MKNKDVKNKRFYIILGIIGITIFILTGSTYIYIKNSVDKWENKIYPNVTINKIEVGSLTKNEAIEKLNNELNEKISDKTISLNIGEEKNVLSYKDLEVKYDFESTIDEALAYGKDKSLLKKFELLKGVEESKNIDVELNYNKEKLEKFEDDLKSKINTEAKNATISIDEGKINITKEVVGKSLDKEKLHEVLVKNIEESSDENLNDSIDLTIYIKENSPKIKEVDLKKITGKISGHNTRYNITVDGREQNMKIACNTINKIVLMPGETFSYNAIIGETTKEKGYEKANTYVGGEVVPDYGGGICQVSTTLYRAVMRANIKSTERSSHSMIVSYSEPGLDATVANDYIDYKFVNTYDFPIYIEAFLENLNVYVNIYGNKEALNNKTYDLVNEIHEKYNYGVKYEEDNTLERGKEKVYIYGMPGYKVSSYLVTYENGVEISREYIATDSYKALDTIIKKGIKKL